MGGGGEWCNFGAEQVEFCELRGREGGEGVRGLEGASDAPSKGRTRAERCENERKQM